MTWLNYSSLSTSKILYSKSSMAFGLKNSEQIKLTGLIHIQHIIHVWAMSWENLSSTIRENKKGANKPAHLCSLIHTFVVQSADSIITKVYVNTKPSLWIASETDESSSSPTWVHIPEGRFTHNVAHMSLVTRKPVFGVSDNVRLKPACSATETSYSLEILDLASIGIILSSEQQRCWSDCTDV